MGGFTFRREWSERVKARALALGSDGCTAVSEWNQVCCFHHDVMCRTGHDIDGQPITREEADWLFWECNRIRSRSRLSVYDPRSWVRYIGVRLGAYNSKRTLKR